ncbi:hypothetical protein [Mucilaginibacter sp.]|uniref:hypothetical protein n=1 Tax=Mucilaginibacter sp. TaxID=1882438 RepID=UPI003D145F9A
MTEPKTFCYTSPRNFRYLFLVDDQVTKELVCKIILTNYRYWGGRYNPIIPTQHNEIDPAYINLIQHQDPDYVFYAPGIDLAVIKGYWFLNPRKYIEINERVGNDMEGVEANQLLQEDVINNFGTSSNRTLIYINEGVSFPTKQFYQLNFGVTPFYMGEDRYTKNFVIIKITQENFGEINKYLHEEKPFFKSHLSELNANATTVRAKNEWATKQLEFIIYDDENSVNDLLYFWNRQLYQQPDNRIKQLIASRNEFEQLLLDRSFEGFLYEMLYGASVYVVSKSIPDGELNLLIGKIQEQYKFVNFLPVQEKTFPYPFFQTIMIGAIHPIKNLLLGTQDYLKLPKPVIGDTTTISGNYVFDIELVKETNRKSNRIKFPNFTEFFHMVCQQEGRINRNNNICLFLGDAYIGIDAKVPSALEIIRMRLMVRNEGQERVQLPITYPVLSNAGQRLSAFIKLFENNWQLIDDFTGDKFWLDLFMGNSEFKDGVIVAEKVSTTSNESESVALPVPVDKKEEVLPIKNRHEFEASKYPGNKGIFSYKDLLHERTLIYFHHREDIKNLFKRESADFEVDEDYLDDFIRRNITEDLKTHIDGDLQYLVERDAMFIGMKVKCFQCGSNSWYSLNELQNKMNCKGCLNQVIPKFNSHLYYKLNDVLINNLVEASSNARRKPYHGNYVVLRTLAWLKNDSRNCHDSFLYAPCLEFEVREANEEPWTTDIDILAIQDGKLIIGEAKSNAKQFNTEVMKQLAWFGNNIRPDMLILAYDGGTIDAGKLDKLRKAVTYEHCKIVTHQVGQPWYRSGRIFGLPHKMEGME